MDKSAEKHFSNLEKHLDVVLAAEKYLWKHPEVGFKEWDSSYYLADQFEKLGFATVKAGNIPGFYVDLITGRPGPKLLCIGELDAIFCKLHPDANPQTHAVHACGHHIQGAALLGIAAAMSENNALDNLWGSIRLMAVPAEELIDINTRLNLREKGLINYLNGKNEFMHRGFFDGVDIVFMVHTTSDPPGTLAIRKGCNGCLVKVAVFKGISSHAGFSPHLGKNALYAAIQGINAINALRETFVDEEHIRVHPIISKGGDGVSTIPDEVVLETYVRGANHQSIYEVNDMVNRALAASAASLGCNVKIMDMHAYFPMTNDPDLIAISEQAMGFVTDKDKISIRTDIWETYSTDMGDVSAIFPVVYINCGGAIGKSHGSDYRISDVSSACINSAKCQLMLIDLLLRNKAKKAEDVIKKRRQPFTSIKEYLTFIDNNTCTKDAVHFNSNRTITLTF